MTRRPSRAPHQRPGRVAAAVVAVVALLAPAGAAAQQQVRAPADAIRWEAPPPDWPTPPPASAQSYVLEDATTGQVLAERDADDPRVVASTVKLLTVLTALQTLSPDQEVVVDPAAAIGGAGTSVDPGETWRVADLLDAVLVRSGNDAATALAAAAADGDIDAFVQQMQATADDLGLDGAVIADPTGLDDTNRLSAQHLATLARVALADERIRASAGQDVVDLPDIGAQENRNLLIGTFPGATGLKTGFTDLAGYCLVASARRDGRELVAVVLGAREDPARFEEAGALLEHGFERFDSLDLPALAVRHPGGWTDLLPASRLWVPTTATPAVALTGDEGQLVLRAGTEDRTLGAARRSSRPPRSARWAGRWRRRCTPACGGPTSGRPGRRPPAWARPVPGVASLDGVVPGRPRR